MKIPLCLLLAFVLVCLIECRSYYDILGVKKDESTGGVKKAFRNLALKFHPDKVKNPDKDTEANFREIVAAYEVLSDPEKRKVYDMSGNTNFNENHKHDDFDYNDFFKNFDEAFKAHHDAHIKAHQRAHREALRRSGFKFNFDDIFDDAESIHGHGHGHGHDDHADVSEFGDTFFGTETTKTEKRNGQTCTTYEKRNENTVVTRTVCS